MCTMAVFVQWLISTGLWALKRTPTASRACSGIPDSREPKGHQEHVWVPPGPGGEGPGGSECCLEAAVCSFLVKLCRIPFCVESVEKTVYCVKISRLEAPCLKDHFLLFPISTLSTPSVRWQHSDPPGLFDAGLGGTTTNS